MKILTKCLLLLLVVAVSFVVSEDYEGYSLVSVDKTSLSPSNYNKFRRLRHESGPTFIFLKESDTQIAALQNDDGAFLKNIFEGNVPNYTVLESNFKRVIDAERSSIEKKNEQIKLEKSKGQHKSNWSSNYRSYGEAMDWYRNLSKSYPMYVEYIENISNQTTAENRQIFAIRIYNRTNQLKNEDERKVIWIESLLHAREWLAGATVNYITATIVDQLVNTNKGNPSSDLFRLTKLINDGKIEFIIIPICNPDGYEYTWTTNRLWRKNRSYFGKGVDLNRNFDSNWGYSGSSRDIHSEVYSGPNSASEVETIALESLFKQNVHRIVLTLDFHTFSQFVLWPWSYSSFDTHPKEETHRNSAKLLSSSGVKYDAMKSATMYASSGAASDYYAQNDVVSLTVELPPKHMAGGGFIVPPDNIEPVGIDWMTKVSKWAVTTFHEAD